MNGIDLSKLVPKESDLGKRTVWVDFKGVRFKIRYISRATLMSIAEHCTIAGYDQVSKTRNRRLDIDKYVGEIASTIVQDWEKCTVESLSKLMVMNVEGLTEEQIKAPIPFTRENLVMVIKNVHDLDGFLQDCSVDADLFKPTQDGELTKNLPGSPSTP